MPVLEEPKESVVVGVDVPRSPLVVDVGYVYEEYEYEEYEEVEPVRLPPS